MFKFLKKIFSFIKLLLGNVDEWVTDHVTPAINFVNGLKNVLENPVTDLITALIPGSVDDMVRQKLLVACSKALQMLQLTAEITNSNDPVQQIQLLLEYLKGCSPTMRGAIYQKLASTIAKLHSGKTEIKGHSIDLLTQTVYSQMLENVNIEDLPDTEETEEVKAAIDQVEKWTRRR